MNDLDWLKKRVDDMRASFTTSRTPKPEPLPPDPINPHGARITLEMPDNTVLKINASAVKLSLDRDFIDASAFGDINKTYLAGIKRFRIEGEYR